MSAFYLDILKDRMYTSKADSLDRWSAQTVMYRILDTLVRLTRTGALLHRRRGLALHAGTRKLRAYTWPPSRPSTRNGRMMRWSPAGSASSRSVPMSPRRWNWPASAKIIGHSLDAAVAITAPPELLAFLREYEAELAGICYRIEGCPDR